MARPDRRILLNSFLLGAALVVAVGVVIWMRGGPETEGQLRPAPPPAVDEPPTIAFGPFEYDVERLEQEWQDERAAFGALTIGPDEEALIADFHRLNAQSIEPPSHEQLLALNDLMVVSVSQYLSVHGPRSYRAIGWYLVDEFQDALRESQRRAETEGMPPWEILELGDNDAQRLRERLGNFYDAARESGLVDQRGRIAFDPTLLTALFRYRWFGFAEDYANLSLLTPYERVVIWRWRIEAAQGIPTVQKLAMVDAVESVYGDERDPDVVRGILHYQAGDLEEARSFFRRAVRHHPDDERYPQYLRTVDAEIGAADE